ncbi:glycosyltransferase family 4 protein [Rubricoccus marinus]|uniref:Glycosyltransferase subfamily 4-like N-terminal domain-containing protein n=1 Tax=Rubricoccus marinus TaxID=716817 RepID=A0A259U0R3_9BACT|nr:glycosyltransferase family 4 protein [Rubricoccus marinus]OZC03414.1 hypothetical protein BSZ36_10730 [Rubricoccus marinus]
MTILYLNPALTNFGPGPAVHGNALVEQLRGIGEDVVTYPSVLRSSSAVSGGVPAVLRKVKRSVEQSVGPVLRVPYSIQRGLRSASAMQSVGADVVLARHTAYDLSPALLARRLGKPLVLEVNAPIYIEQRLLGIRERPLLYAMERASWRAADCIYAVSNAVRDAIIDVGISPGKIAVIYNGATPDPIAPMRGAKDAGEEIEIVFVGSLYKWQHLGDMIRALAESRARGTRVRLTVVGTGDYLESARLTAEEYGVADFVTFLGRVPHDEVREQLRAADIAVAPYPKLEHFYFLPLKLFEYMAMALPVIASDQGQVQSVLSDGETGLLYAPGDVGALSKAIDTLAVDPDLRARLGGAARARLESRYTWRHTAEHVRDLCVEARALHDGRPVRLIQSS